MLMHRPHVPKVADHVRELGLGKLNSWLAVKITEAVGTMTCAWIFAVIALISFPDALASGNPVIVVQWFSSVFIQLVLLSIIMVGQRVQSVAADQRANATYLDTEEILKRLDAVTRVQLDQQIELLAAINLIASRTAADKKPKS